MTGRTFLTASLLALAATGGCATTKTIATPRYTLTMPEAWQVKAEAVTDGVPTVVVIADPSMPADVEVRVFAWPAPTTDKQLSAMVGNLLAGDGTLQLPRHVALPTEPPECDLVKPRYTMLGREQQPLDLVSRPGWRTIVVGGAALGSLVGVVARIEYQQDVGLYCLGLGNMQVQLQKLLDGLKVVPPRGSASGPEKSGNP